MFATMISSLVAPRYPRRYVGRHRMASGSGPTRLTRRLVARRPGPR
jgi:hypothetical protein